jgi:uncharacterized membrane-anchored protein
MVNYTIRQSTRGALRKVPEITIIFWLVKLLTTAMGEATSDFLVAKYNPYLAVLIGALVFAVALIVQLKTPKYNAWAYWLAVSMVAVFGTMAADGLHIRLGVPYIASASFFAVALALIFIAWQKSQKTLSIHSIYTPRRELFYWATVLATFALGTALGDLTATTFKLGYFSSGLMFIGIFLIPAVLYYIFKVNEIFCFWFAYIITRPLGASFADWTSKAKSIGGLDYGDGHVAIFLSIVIVILVAYLSISKLDSNRTLIPPRKF